MSKRIKAMIVDEIQQRIGDRQDLLVIDTSRLDGVTSNRLRLAFQAKEIGALAVKNSLAKQALHDKGVTALDDALSGPSTIVWGGEDIISLSKEIAQWTKELGELEIKGGALEGTPLSAEDVVQLSKSPGREELIGQVVGLILSPASQVVGALMAPGGTIVGQLEKMADSEERTEDNGNG